MQAKHPLTNSKWGKNKSSTFPNIEMSQLLNKNNLRKRFWITSMLKGAVRKNLCLEPALPNDELLVPSY